MRKYLKFLQMGRKPSETNSSWWIQWINTSNVIQWRFLIGFVYAKEIILSWYFHLFDCLYIYVIQDHSFKKRLKASFGQLETHEISGDYWTNSIFEQVSMTKLLRLMISQPMIWSGYLYNKINTANSQIEENIFILPKGIPS